MNPQQNSELGSNAREKNKHRLGVLIALIFFIFLAYYNVMLYNSYNYSIYDLGLAYRTLYLFITNHSLVNWPSPHLLVTAKPYTKLLYVPLSLGLLLYNSPATLLVEMGGMIALGGYAVYRIFTFMGHNSNAGILGEIVYFLFTPTYGFMAHGGNFMTFFPPLFLVGFMYLQERKYIRSLISFTLASLATSFGSLIIIAFIIVYFASTNLHPVAWGKSLKTGSGEPINLIFYKFVTSKNTVYFFTFLIIGLLLFIYEVHVYGLFGLITAARINVSSGSAVNSPNISNNFLHTLIISNESLKLKYLYDLLIPLLFIPLLTSYAVLVVPYVLFVWYANFVPYYNVAQQYPSLVSAILFISTATFLFKHFSKKNLLRVMSLIAVVSLFSFLILSPFNLQSIESGSISKNAEVTPLEKNLTSAFQRIPINSSVLIQNDMPQLMNRAQVFMPGTYNNQTVDYAVFAPFGFSQVSNLYGGYSSYWAHEFENNSSYGVFMYIQGITIYKLDYHSSPVVNITGNARNS